MHLYNLVELQSISNTMPFLISGNTEVARRVKNNIKSLLYMRVLFTL